MATMKDVARRAGVSTATVSYVMNNRMDKVGQEAAKRVREAAEELGYLPNMMARALRSQKTRIIGVLTEDIVSFQACSILQGINQAADELGYQLIMGDLALADKIWSEGKQDYSRVPIYREEIRKKQGIFKAAGAGGMIYVGMHDRDVTGLLETDMPLIYAYCYSRMEGCGSVNADNQTVSRRIVREFIQKGHRRIGLICGPQDSVPSERRLRGYREALEEAGITLDSKLIVRGNWSISSGRQACGKLMERDDPPTAIFSMNDWMAFGVMECLREKGIRIPEDVELTGFDNIDFCELAQPPLASVEIPMAQIGREAVEMAVAMMEGKIPENLHRVLPCRRVARASFMSQAVPE